MEIRSEVKTFRIQYKCSKCKRGFLEYIGTRGALYVHRCNNKECLHMEEISDKQYPYIEYEEDRNNLFGQFEKRYIVCGTEDNKAMLYGYPTGNGDDWQCFGSIYKIAKEQQDKVRLKQIFSDEEIEIRKIEDVDFAFIKAIS